MQFRINNINKSVHDVMRTIGYQLAYFQKEGEVSIVRQLTRGEYPRFHAYIIEKEGGLNINLHLDQKKPSYEGSRGHSGEYDGTLVENEAERIKQLLSNA